MRIRNIVMGAFVLVLAIPGIASAQRPADNGFKVTGGGQIIADSSAGGAGDTVGFNAQLLGDGTARGQFQYVPRGESEGTEQEATEKFHGVVTCLESTGSTMARFGGHLRDDSEVHFTVDVTDNGQGGDSEDDMILVRITDEPCADNPEGDDHEEQELLRLGRGNVKIHNSPDGEAGAAAVAAPAVTGARIAAGALTR